MPTLGRQTKRHSALQSIFGVPTQDCKLSNNCFTAALPSLIDTERHPALSVLCVSNPQTCWSISHPFPVSTLEIRTPGCGSHLQGHFTRRQSFSWRQDPTLASLRHATFSSSCSRFLGKFYFLRLHGFNSLIAIEMSTFVPARRARITPCSLS